MTRQIRTALFMVAALLLFGACNSFESFPPNRYVRIENPFVSLDGTRGQALIRWDVDTHEKASLIVKFNKHTTVLDTTVYDEGKTVASFQTEKGWGHPPIWNGDVFVVELKGDDWQRRDSTQSTERLP